MPRLLTRASFPTHHSFVTSPLRVKVGAELDSKDTLYLGPQTLILRSDYSRLEFRAALETHYAGWPGKVVEIRRVATPATGAIVILRHAQVRATVQLLAMTEEDPEYFGISSYPALASALRT